MTHRFAHLMFTPAVKHIQEKQGSRASYARLEAPGAPANDRLDDAETAFVAARDSFYMATLSEIGWPYVQHRGGPKGFLKVIDERTLGFADYRGNKQYVSVGNLVGDDRVSLFLMDYPNRRRLKIIGRARTIDAVSDPVRWSALQDQYPAAVERGILVSIEGFDWNCPQHITPRFDDTEIGSLIAPLRDELQRLRTENASMHARLDQQAAKPDLL